MCVMWVTHLSKLTLSDYFIQIWNLLKIRENREIFDEKEKENRVSGAGKNRCNFFGFNLAL